MTDYTLTPKTGHFKITGHSANLLVLGDLELDPSGRFYLHMLAFLAASAGLTPVYDAKNYPHFMSGTAGVFPANGVGAQVNLAECIAAVRNNALPQQQAEILLTGMLANAAYESLTDAEKRSLAGNPTYEVFFHVRNAASHANKWFFKPGIPKHPAHWKGLVVDHMIKGDTNTLHGKQCIHGSLSPGQVLFLLRDVEKLL